MHTPEFVRTLPSRPGRLPALVGLAALLLSPQAAHAATSQTTGHISVSAEGAVFECQGGDLTATTGTFNQLIHTNVDAHGVIHIPITLTVDEVSLTDSVGNMYTLAGATRIGGKAEGLDADSPFILATDTEHLVVRRSTEGVYATVHSVAHVSPNGRTFAFDGGAREPPQNRRRTRFG